MIAWRRVAAMAVVMGVAATPAVAASPLEQQVLAAVNFARTNPAAYAEMLKQYRGYIHNRLISLPGSREDIETNEGASVVDETIDYLAHQQPLPAIEPAEVLAGSAADHTAEQASTGDTGHSGRDGSSPAERVRRRGGGTYVAEVIAYGSVDAIDAVRQLIVDDGVYDRGHRAIIYSRELRYAGVSCGRHREFRTMCTIDLAVTPDGRFPAIQMAEADISVRHGGR